MKRWTFRIRLMALNGQPLPEPITIENRSRGHFLRRSAEESALRAMGALMEVGYRGNYEIVQLVNR